MIEIGHSAIINRPVSEVFAFVADVNNVGQWQSPVTEARKTSEGPIGAGTQYSYAGQFLGKQIEVVTQITEFEPDKKLAFKSVSGPKAEAAWTFAAVEDGTKVDMALQGEVGGLFNLAEPVLARMLSRRIEADWSNLKDLLESRTENRT